MGETCSQTAPVTINSHIAHGGIAVVELIGEVDIACEEQVRAALDAAFDRGPTGLVVDLTGTDFFGSTGIRLLVDSVQRAHRQGIALVVATDRRAVLRPLSITFVDQAVRVHPTAQDAVRSLLVMSA
ncbi:STAS domain-containing protein [Saccharothrix sp. Mg75]|uniref:STAS domain-containing protein n=1 Tax=Saccharothrix sp. Mg75 TaxID=3445357 RepID=UPI003EE8F62A